MHRKRIHGLARIMAASVWGSGLEAYVQKMFESIEQQTLYDSAIIRFSVLCLPSNITPHLWKIYA